MSVFAMRYACALADVVMADKLDIREIDRQLGEFLATFEGSKELREVFANPSIPLDCKLKVVDSIAPLIGMSRQVRNFLALLAQNDRTDAVGSIVAEYRREMNLRQNIGEAEIFSVRELSADERSRIEQKAAALAGMRVRATYKQDPSLIGGVLLRIGDTVYDGSLRGSLEELHEKLIAN